MKYEGTRPSGKDKDIPVYVFSVGKEELNMLAKLTQKALEYTHDLFELMAYRGRLRNLAKIFGRVWVEDVKEKMLPTKHTSRFYAKIKKHL